MASAQSSAAIGAASALDLHEGISDPGPAEQLGCPRWPELLRLRSSNGELVRGRCRATNQCAYCARLAAVETAELLALDAVEGGRAPALWAVLTTRSTEPEPRAFYASRRQVQRALRRRWPDCELAWVIEFTTGYGPRAAGGRRPHWNVLIKGVPVDAIEAVREAIAAVWCAREDAEPWAQFVGAVSEVGGLMRYLALHFLKESQAPPPGWSGHRFSATRGYLWTATPAAREAARASLAGKRALWRAIRSGLSGEAAEEAAARELELAAATTWELFKLAAPTVPARPADAPPAVGAARVTSEHDRGDGSGLDWEDDGTAVYRGEDVDALLGRLASGEVRPEGGSSRELALGAATDRVHRGVSAIVSEASGVITTATTGTALNGATAAGLAPPSALPSSVMPLDDCPMALPPPRAARWS